MSTQMYIVSNDHERQMPATKTQNYLWPLDSENLVILRPTKYSSKILYRHEGQNNIVDQTRRPLLRYKPGLQIWY